MAATVDTGKVFFFCSISVRSHIPRPRLLHFSKFNQYYSPFERFQEEGTEVSPQNLYQQRKCSKSKEKTGEITVNVKLLKKAFGAYGFVVLEIKCIIEGSQWHCARLVLEAEKCDWYLITNIYWKRS